MSTIRRRAFIAAALTITAAGCGPMRKNNAPPRPPAEVIFSNQSLDQADVYAVSQGGNRQRIGTVMAGRTDTLRVQSSVIGASGVLNIVARVLARGYTPSTGQVTLLPGDRIAVTLPPDQRMLTVLPVRDP